jgi:hypothetical protein
MAKGFSRSPVRALTNWEKINKITEEHPECSTFIDDIVAGLQEIEEGSVEPADASNSQ